MKDAAWIERFARRFASEELRLLAQRHSHHSLNGPRAVSVDALLLRANELEHGPSLPMVYGELATFADLDRISKDGP